MLKYASADFGELLKQRLFKNNTRKRVGVFPEAFLESPDVVVGGRIADACPNVGFPCADVEQPEGALVIVAAFADK